MLGPMSELTRDDYLHTLRNEASLLAELDPEHLTLPLPHIDGWTVHDVVGHTGWVCRWVSLSVTADPEDPPERALVPEPPAGADVIPWFEESVRLGLEALEATDADRLVPTFTGPQPASWWVRRMAHEVAMHRWDAQASYTSPEPIDPDIARDGIAEILEIFAPARLQFDLLQGSGETIHLHATDIDHGEWLLTLQADRIDWEAGHIKADVAAKGPVSDLLLLLWSRLPPSRLDTFGDATLLDRWQQAATF